MKPRSNTPRRKPTQVVCTGKQVRGVAHLEVRVLLAVDGDVGEDADAQSLAHVLLDHVRVPGGERHVGRQAFFGEQLHQRSRAAEAEGIGDERILRELGHAWAC